MSHARFCVGIDLGTTNSALAEVELPQDASSKPAAPRTLPVPQVAAPGSVGESPLLPSFVYLPSAHEAAAAAWDLPWAKQRGYVLGGFARDRGALVPGRLVSSAKSWLSHPGVDLRAQLLPRDADPEVQKISPLDASARILGHLREAWESAHPGLSLRDQAVTLTVPASFDASARDLTLAAAKEAGLPEVTLLEEPQAALYAWVQAAGEAWRKEVAPGDVILVIDVGGGTSDFSLIAVGEAEGQLALTRLAVGDHILLGGDNIDLALAHRVREKLAAAGTQLDAWQFAALTHACRQAKESAGPEGSGNAPLPIAIPGRGSRLVGGTVRAELTREELRAVVDSFFPEVGLEASPKAARRIGLTALGLPYAQDPGITRHLAAFLRAAGAPKSAGGAPARPTAILFNGGVFRDEALQARMARMIEKWVMAEGGPRLKRLRGQGLDLAVALGAAYSGLSRTGRGIRIRGGTSRAYYVGVESSVPAVPGYQPPLRGICVAPQGMEEGTSVELPDLTLGAVVGEVASFRFFSSAQRRGDVAGSVVEDARELAELPAVEATLPPGEGAKAGDVIPVGLRASATEVGTLELRLVSRSSRATGTPREWRLEFSVRGEEPSGA